MVSHKENICTIRTTIRTNMAKVIASGLCVSEFNMEYMRE